jgi:type II secretory pathway pseudopilin PulG
MRERGFSLIEALVATAVVAVVMIGLLSLLDSSTRISKAQTATSESQESLRYALAHVVRGARMVGSGGLPPATPGLNLPGAVEVRDNVAADSLIFGGRTVLANTDVLEMRGAFTGDLLDLASAGGSYSYDGSGAGTLTIAAATVSGESQADAIARLGAYFEGHPEARLPAVIVAAQRNDMALDGGRARAMANYGTVLITAVDGTTGAVSFVTAGSGDAETDFLSLSPGGAFPTGLANPVRVAVVDSLAFFIALDDDGVPTLYRHDRVTNQVSPLVSDVVDLQVAMGCDRDGDGVIVDSQATPDEWLFNVNGETLGDKYNGSDASILLAYLTQLRITLVARIPAPERGWDQRYTGGSDLPAQAYRFENGRDLTADPAYQGIAASGYRYRALTERVKLRSLGPIM